MLINNNNNNVVKFVSYSGRYPYLCMGVLILMIDGEEVKFGHNYLDYDFKTNKYKDNNYDQFWSSGGGFTQDYMPYCGEWKIDVNEIPEKYRKYVQEIDNVFNTYVPKGCCGGCL